MRQWSPNTEERFIAILNGELVFALCCKNLCSNIERQPEFRIGVQHGFRTGKVTISQLILGVITQIAAGCCAPLFTIIGTLARMKFADVKIARETARIF